MDEDDFTDLTERFEVEDLVERFEVDDLTERLELEDFTEQSERSVLVERFEETEFLEATDFADSFFGIRTSGTAGTAAAAVVQMFSRVDQDWP